MIAHSPLHEIVPATHTPFHPDGSLAPEVVAEQARFLSAHATKTVFITGSTGESHSLSTAEKIRIYDAWAAAAPMHGLSVIAHVGGNSIEDAKTLARHARDCGFRAISALSPSYYKPSSLDTLIDCCAAIAREAPELPFYYYDIPALTGVTFPMEEFLRQAPRRIANLAGIKFTNPDLVSYRRALEAAGKRHDLPWGVDESLLAALAVGAKGGVGSTFNWAPQLYRNLIDAFASGDMAAARAHQSTAIAMIDAIASTGFLGTAKALMARLGVPVGPARLPLGNPTESQVDALMVKLGELGFRSWGAKALEPETAELGIV